MSKGATAVTATAQAPERLDAADPTHQPSSSADKEPTP